MTTIPETCGHEADLHEACIDACTMVDCKGPHEQCHGHPDQPGECVCLDGFQRVNGSCVDVDECTSLQIPPCSQVLKRYPYLKNALAVRIHMQYSLFHTFQYCINGNGNFLCECEVGYQLDHSGNCKALSLTGPAVLYLSGATEIRSHKLQRAFFPLNNYGLITEDGEKVRQAIGVEYDSTDARVYWADVYYKFIAR